MVGGAQKSAVGRCAAMVKLREGECGWRRCRAEVAQGEMFCGRHRDMADGVVLGWCVERDRRESGK